jgi:hypothetical protein
MHKAFDWKIDQDLLTSPFQLTYPIILSFYSVQLESRVNASYLILGGGILGSTVTILVNISHGFP